ncbi:MAG: hypothetical protein ACRDYZ_02805 [Acidimicrobiales bacterium]
MVWGSCVATLVVLAFVVPHLHLRWLSPIVDKTAHQYRALAQTAPFLGRWMPHGNWATVCAVVVAVGVVAFGPSVVRTLPWRRLLLGSWLVSAVWAMSLTLIDGWGPGFVHRMESSNGYRFMVPRVGGVADLFRTFVSHIPAGHPGSWNLAVSGHPPGALLTFVGLDRLGMGGPVWASAFCVATGTSAAAAVLIAVRALSNEGTARRVAPFVVLAPAAVWIAVSADAYYAGVAAWGLALLALSATGATRWAREVGVAAGVLLGFALYLDYGLVLMGIPALAILAIARNYRPLVGAGLGALAVVAVFTSLGFWWFHGLTVLRHRYWSGIAGDRPFAYWSWGNLASLTGAVGLGAATALRRAFAPPALRRAGLHLLLVAFVVVVVVADLSALSKAETERIWLPFSVWLVAAPALLPQGSHRFTLGVQAVGALVINSLLFTTW